MGTSLAQREEMLESALPALLALDQVECPVVHSFGPGVYMREVLLPAGSLIIGHHHNSAHMNIMLCGRLTLANDDGTFTELSAPAMMTSGPGRKIAVIHEDVVWINVYATTETDVDVLESTLLDKGQTFLDFQATQSRAASLRLTCDRSDYDVMLDECGLDADVVWSMSRNEDDMTGLPPGSYKCKVGDSSIQGKGLLATAPIHAGETIAPARIDGKRTIAGRYTNHSPRPNAVMVNTPSGVDLVAIADIAGCRGGMDGEEITIDYRQALALGREG